MVVHIYKTEKHCENEAFFINGKLHTAWIYFTRTGAEL